MVTFTSPTAASPRPPPPPTATRSQPRPPLWHRVRTRLGFQKSYNLLLFLVLGLLGVMGQGLLNSPKLDYFHVFCRRHHLSKGLHAAPGECYYFRNGGRDQVGMMLHVYTVVPVCFLLVLQFVPVVRQRCVLVHRVAGYAVLLLMGVAVGGGVVASPRSFGGELSWRTLIVVLGGMVAGGFGMAMGSIWRLKVEQHRAWMLRTWAWAFSSVTMRILQQIGAQMISPSSSAPSSSSSSFSYNYYYALRPCAQIASDGVMPDGAIATLWPACLAYLTGRNPDQTVLVAANYGGTPIEANVALSVTAGPAGWIALLLHVFAVEIYLHLTSSEKTPSRLRPLEQVAFLHKQQANRGGLAAAAAADDSLCEPPKWFSCVRRCSTTATTVPVVEKSKSLDSKSLGDDDGGKDCLFGDVE